MAGLIYAYSFPPVMPKMSLRVFQMLFYIARLAHPTVRVSARIPMAQTVLETGQWTSNLAVNAKNIFGMMFPQARNTTAIDKTAQGFAVYRSQFDCIKDYFLWLEAMNLLNDAALDGFIAANRYAADPKYYTKIQANIHAQAPALVSPLQLAGATTAAALAGFFGFKAIKSLV